MPELIFFRRGEELLRVTVAGRMVLGRSEKCDVVIPDPEVSRQQLALSTDGKAVLAEDLSGKGTLIAGERKTQATLTDGADITLGLWSAIFRERSSTTSDIATEVAHGTQTTQQPRDTHAVEPAQIRIRHGNKESVLRLKGESFTAGKDPENDLVLDDPFVSGRHLRVVRRDGFFSVSDQRSTNGTWVGNVRVVEAEVPFFTTLRVGEAELVLEPFIASQKQDTNYQGIIGNHPTVRQLSELIERVAPSSAAVAIFGESGTGKELVARAVHNRSSRSERPFVPVNCAAISKDLIESELFGHEKGAFTGAINARKGAFEEADSGTLFLDEIGELSLDLQAKLLRALESGEIKKVGAPRPTNVDVRIVAATNRDLLAQARKGAFREDLYYRLCVIPLHLPPLRNRLDDVSSLAEHFVRTFSPRGREVKLSKPALERLRAHRWPGNIRELRNVIHRALLLRNGAHIEAPDITFDTETLPDVDSESISYDGTLEQILQRVERMVIEARLRRANFNRMKVAKELGISRSTLFKRLREWGFNVGNDEEEKAGEA